MKISKAFFVFQDIKNVFFYFVFLLKNRLSYNIIYSV